jgi:hypothetical protein
MSQYTDQYEVDPKDYRELGYHMDNRYSIRENKPDWVMASLLVMLNLLAAACVVGIISMQGKLAAFEARFNDLENKVDMIAEGRIRIPDGR